MDLRSQHRINPRPSLFVSGKANEYRWRPRRYQVPGRGLGGENVRGASYALLPNLKKCLFFCHRGRIENFCLFSTRPWTNIFVSDAWPASATYHRPCCEHCDQAVSRSPYRAHLVKNSWRGRWFCRSRCLSRTRNLAASNWTFGWVFLRPILAQHLARNDFFRFFLEKFATFFFLKILCS